MLSSDGDQDRRKTSQESSDRLKERLCELERKLRPGIEECENISEQERGRRSSALGKALQLSTELVLVCSREAFSAGFSIAG